MYLASPHASRDVSLNVVLSIAVAISFGIVSCSLMRRQESFFSSLDLPLFWSKTKPVHLCRPFQPREVYDRRGVFIFILFHHSPTVRPTTNPSWAPASFRASGCLGLNHACLGVYYLSIATHTHTLSLFISVSVTLSLQFDIRSILFFPPLFFFLSPLSSKIRIIFYQGRQYLFWTVGIVVKPPSNFLVFV